MTGLSTASLPQRLYRITRAVDPRDFTAWDYIDPSQPGRWDDPRREYRLLYTADTVVGAFTEVLQDLRPQLTGTRTRALLDAVEDEENLDPRVPLSLDLNESVIERLRDRRVGELIPVSPSDRVVRILDPPSRSWLENKIRGDSVLSHAFEMVRIKNGDLIGSDYTLCRAASRLIWEEHRELVGIVAPSSELVDVKCFALFESNGGRTRAMLTAGFASPALHSTVRYDLDLALELMLAPAPRT